MKVRATAVLIEDGHILLVEQRVNESRGWSLPGGALEEGETLAACLARELLEETGLDIVVDRLLYVCDRIAHGRHVLHITFAVQRTGGSLQVGHEPEAGANQINSVEMVPVVSLGAYGFSRRFLELAVAGFPDSGTYQGDIANIGL